MSLMKLQKLIDSGDSLSYRDKVAVIKSFEDKHGQYEITVVLDGKPTIFTKKDENAIGLWLDSFSIAVKIYEEEIEVKPKLLPAIKHRPDVVELYNENKGTLMNMSKMLLEDIERVRSDPKYVPQAKQVCNSINAIVNITKLQVQLLKGE